MNKKKHIPSPPCPQNYMVAPLEREEMRCKFKLIDLKVV